MFLTFTKFSLNAQRLKEALISSQLVEELHIVTWLIIL